MTQQKGGTGAQVRIRCEHNTLGNPNTFIRECYDAWRDGCFCLACRVVDSYEGNQSSAVSFRARMELLGDVVWNRHGDGVWLLQLEIWPDCRDARVQ